jgi:hypothetical protein
MSIRTWKIDDPDHPLRTVIDYLRTHHLMNLDQVQNIQAEVTPHGWVSATVTFVIPPESK